MARDRALTLEALRVMDAIDRRGSFAAAADELGRVPSALSYTMQKLEEELDVVLFDRSGHRTKFTNVGRMLLERGRVLLEAADKLTTDAEALARGGKPISPSSAKRYPLPTSCSLWLISWR
ncbi:HTH-type transcriptional activator CmpR [Serratia fonticola]|uniref:HTH-type transcriptional activator CmpR n=1 Tax=Serratia fonticola TaxID=47917 RepID=A0A4U9W8I2_SERFO|nr:HTH-type transcriptional activator CmpR [Serratia fonticola]